MATIQHYICDAEVFPRSVIRKQTSLQEIEKQRHFAALIIQRVWRGYVVRKEIKRWHAAATVLQKYIRRFLVKWHMPQIYQDYMKWYREKVYNLMATKIQAMWRGYWLRKNSVSPRELLEARRRIERANAEVLRQMREAFANMERLRREALEKEAREWVLYILFRLHHLLRTYCREGIYSLHNKNKLSTIEKLLKSMKMGDYMKDLKEKYYDEIEKQPPHTYMFQSKKLQHLEDAYLKFMKMYGPKVSKTICAGIDRHGSISQKPFVLTSKLPKRGYDREMLYTEKYPQEQFSFARKTEFRKHVSDKDFDLNVLKKIVIDLKPPPYYLDFWQKLCDIHNISDY